MAGFWDFLGRVGNAIGSSSAVSYGWMTPQVEYLGALEWDDRVRETWEDVRGMSPAQLWRTQPHLRTVVSFLGRNVAQLGLHVFERVSDTDRRRDRTNPFSLALADPGDHMTTYDLIYALAVDKLLYDRAFWLPYVDGDGKYRMRRLPPSWVTIGERTPFGVTTYRVSMPNGTVDVPVDRVLAFNGYSPSSLTGCSPVIEALKETLAEQIESTKYRGQIWKRGGRTSAVIQRPLDAPKWTDSQANRFRDDWYANYTGDGPRAGGTPILEDGMTIQRVDFNASDMQWVEGAKLSFATVSSAYHVNPTMVGLLDNANYSNVREFRRMLYGDTLGPYLAELEGVFNTFGIPYFGMDPLVFYAEFNIAEKLQGSFEEQAAVMQTMVGAPIMTRNEGRARFNLPKIDGGDELVTPLNVLLGGQASPTDSGTQNVTGTNARKALTSNSVRCKTRGTVTEIRKAEQVVNAFFKRQESAVRSRLGAKATPDWWDKFRWDKELADDLYALAATISEQVAARTLQSIGFEPSAYDVGRTLKWLKEVSRRAATSLNEGTYASLEAALGEDDPTSAVDRVFASQTSRATMVAVSTTTLLAGFATHEAAKQVAGDAATKTWVVTSSNPRPSHVNMNGETVPLSENFSNGAAWPGDASALPAEEVANCSCELQINVEAS